MIVLTLTFTYHDSMIPLGNFYHSHSDFYLNTKPLHAPKIFFMHIFGWAERKSAWKAKNFSWFLPVKQFYRTHGRSTELSGWSIDIWLLHFAVRALAQPKSSRPHIPVSNFTKRSFLSSSPSVDSLATGPVNDTCIRYYRPLEESASG